MTPKLSFGLIRFDWNVVMDLVELNFRGSRNSQLKTSISYWINGMSSSTASLQSTTAENIKISEDTLTVELSDGRTIAVPLDWYPRLSHGNDAERQNWRLIGGGHGIHWPELDEDISVEGLLAGKPSGESQNSLQKWLASRK
jgi:hypothetical protein